MLLRGLLCGLIAALVAAGCGGGEEKAARDDLPQKLDAELAKRADELDVPGAAAALYRRGELVWSGAWGKADIEADRAMTAQTPVAYASVGKMITAALALRLAEQRRLSLDDPVRKWVPTWPGERSKTLRDLLGHNGGIEDAPESFYSAQSASRRGGSRPRTGSPPCVRRCWRMRTSTTTPASWPPEWRCAAPRAPAGSPCCATPRPTSRCSPSSAWTANRRADTCTREGAGKPQPFGDGGRFVPSTSLATAAWTSGGYAGSAEAMARWADHLFAGEVIDQDSLSEMTDFKPSTALGDAYGLGLGRWEIDGEEVWGHQGGMPGFRTELAYMPKEGLTLFAVWNDDLIDQDTIPRKLIEVALSGG